MKTYYEDHFQRHSIDDRGMPILNNIRCMLGWKSNATVTYALDVHEMTHGVTGLEYRIKVHYALLVENRYSYKRQVNTGKKRRYGMIKAHFGLDPELRH